MIYDNARYLEAAQKTLQTWMKEARNEFLWQLVQQGKVAEWPQYKALFNQMMKDVVEEIA